ncbi:MAG: DUF4433 domain-containing protein [Verrucomicrobiae bacterium]|nr:DUF4433 domain-containing protein [Verrucomicrobiae bacterium]
MSALNPDKALIFRITHMDNVPWLLRHGLHCQNAAPRDPQYRVIGNPDLIARRQHRHVPVPPYGTLADYVPFYFTPCSIMLYNIRTGHGGVAILPNEEIVILVSSLRRVAQLNIPFVFTDRHAYVQTATFYNSLDDLTKVDWPLLQSRNFRNNPDDPGKKERYQAEALIYRHLPIAGLLGAVCFNAAAQARLQNELAALNLSLRVEARPDLYFT